MKTKSSKSSDESAPKDRHLPPLVQIGEMIAPKAPQDIAHARLDDGTLTDLAIKVAYTLNRFTAEIISKRLHISNNLTLAVLEKLSQEALIEQSMLSSETAVRYKITDR